MTDGAGLADGAGEPAHPADDLEAAAQGDEEQTQPIEQDGTATGAGADGGSGARAGGAQDAQATADDSSVPAAGAGGAGAAAAGDAGEGAAGGAAPDPEVTDPTDYTLDCGPDGVALQSAGPPENRVNYVIVGDGYTEAELETTYLEHVQRMLDLRFTAELEPYLRYRRFVNICALKVASAQSGVGTQPGDTAFRGYGNDESRLGYIDDQRVFEAIRERLPTEIEVDWTGVVLNGDRWWNAGGRIMVWSGGHPDAPLAAMHEGGHTFQRLADEYGGDCTFSGDESRMRVNVTMDPVDTAGKWSHWLDFVQDPGTGLQSTFEGAQYCDRGAWRPSQDSVMNSLWRSSSFNSISLEQAVRVLYEIVRPIDVGLSTPAGATSEQVLVARVVDPEVIQVDWSVDGQLVAEDHGDRLDLRALELEPGSHRVVARAHDDTPWVRGDRSELEQSLEWMVEVP